MYIERVKSRDSKGGKMRRRDGVTTTSCDYVCKIYGEDQKEGWRGKIMMQMQGGCNMK